MKLARLVPHQYIAASRAIGKAWTVITTGSLASHTADEGNVRLAGEDG